ncbi:MAG: NADH-quinone oxidoreductase subunit L [Fimbriimonadales bacterium]
MNDSFAIVWWVPGLALIGFLFQALVGKWLVERLGTALGKRVLGTMAVLPVAAGFVISVILLQRVLLLPEKAKYAVQTLFTWIDVHPLLVPFEVLVDPLSVVMCLVVTGVGGLIHIYATGYMADDDDYPRFFTYFNLFIAFMLVLVLANNLVLMFVGWEGVGLCSYLLIGFWYRDVFNAKCGNKAFIVNRVGDWGFMLGIFLVFVVFGSVSLYASPENGGRSILQEAPDVLARFFGDLSPGNPVFWIPILLFIGAMGKSAQGPLYLWLPDAMAGPTPVSALIHAATMVTAGVYMVSRCHVLFELSTEAMLLVAVIGAFTALFAATVAFGQFDIKKVLAYSTVSQLGYMFLACGVGAFATGMFHVVTHAFFKALLFLGSGAVIMAMAHEQDMRKFGNLRKYLPITYACMVCGWLAISGIPPLAGFWSKDEILAKVFGAGRMFGDNAAWALYAIGLGTAVLTASYMTRMMWMTFVQKDERWRKLPEVHHHDDAHAHHELDPHHTPKEPYLCVWAPVAVLALLSVVGGLVLSGGGFILPAFPHYFEVFTDFSVAAEIAHTGQLSVPVEWLLAGVSVLGAVLGIAWAIRSYRVQPADQELGVEIKGWRAKAFAQWGYDAMMTRTFVDQGGRFALVLWRWFDAGLIDKVFVNGIPKLIETVGHAIRPLQTGYVRGYAAAMLLGIVVIIGWVFLSAVAR